MFHENICQRFAAVHGAVLQYVFLSRGTFLQEKKNSSVS